MVSTGGGSESMSYPKMFPGGKQTLKWLTPEFKDILGGNINNPIAKALYNIASTAAEREVAVGKKSIAETSGLTSPQKAKAMTDLALKGVEQGAKAGITPWQEALEFLKKLGFGVQGQVSQSSTSPVSGVSMSSVGAGLAALFPPAAV